SGPNIAAHRACRRPVGHLDLPGAQPHFDRKALAAPPGADMDPNLLRLQGAADSRSLATLKIDVIADLVCPWSWIGKRRLGDALLAVHGPSRVSWYPFLVGPGTGGDSPTFKDYVKTRFGDPEHLERRLEELRLWGRAEGIEFHFERLSGLPATVDAHRLLKLA